MKNFEEQTATIIGIAYEVMNEVGCGYREKAYERAMIREFQLRSIPYDQQRQFPLFYKDTQIDILIPDLIVFDEIIVDTKTIKAITERTRSDAELPESYQTPARAHYQLRQSKGRSETSPPDLVTKVPAFIPSILSILVPKFSPCALITATNSAPPTSVKPPR